MIRRESTTHSEASNAAFAWLLMAWKTQSPKYCETTGELRIGLLVHRSGKQKAVSNATPSSLTIHVDARTRISRRGSARSSILGYHRDEYREVGLCPPILAD